MNNAIADYFKTQPVLKAWLFGSFARGEETPQSDVDLLSQKKMEFIQQIVWTCCNTSVPMRQDVITSSPTTGIISISPTFLISPRRHLSNNWTN